MKRIIVGRVALLALILIVVLVSRDVHTPAWKTLVNRSGWSIQYPQGWRISSCMSCPDPSDPDVFVAFFSTGNSDDGWVMVQRLQRPTAKTLQDSLAELNTGNNLNPETGHKSVSINGLTGLEVRNVNPFGHAETETVYLTAGPETFSLSFSGDKAGSVDKQPNYPIYRQMVSTFQVR